jgi:uncharacterized protein (DUF2235 family)
MQSSFNVETILINGGILVVALTIFWGGFVSLFKKWMSDRETSEIAIRKEMADSTEKLAKELAEKYNGYFLDLKERIEKVSDKQDELTRYQREANGKVAQVTSDVAVLAQRCNDRVNMHQRSSDMSGTEWGC